MAINKDEGGTFKYEPKGDFGPYNEPSWVPEGFCKVCALIKDPNTQVDRRRTPEELRRLKIVGHTENKNLAIRHCPVCDLV